MSADVVIYLGGGLGNVLFQLNYAANCLDQGENVSIDTSLLNNRFILNLINWTYHKSTIDVLQNLDILSACPFTVENKVWRLLKFTPLLSKFFYYHNFKHTTPGHNNNNYRGIFGYFHSNIALNELFVENIKQRFLHQMKKRKTKTATKSELVIHCRGGDYIKNDLELPRGTVNQEYFKLLERFNDITLVTDDPRYAIENYSKLLVDKKNINILSSNDPLDDFLYMMSANNLLITNSTFSWWASELSNASNIYQPSKFFEHLSNWSPQSTKKRTSI